MSNFIQDILSKRVKQLEDKEKALEKIKTWYTKVEIKVAPRM